MSGGKETACGVHGAPHRVVRGRQRALSCVLRAFDIDGSTPDAELVSWPRAVSVAAIDAAREGLVTRGVGPSVASARLPLGPLQSVPWQVVRVFSTRSKGERDLEKVS